MRPHLRTSIDQRPAKRLEDHLTPIEALALACQLAITPGLTKGQRYAGIVKLLQLLRGE